MSFFFPLPAPTGTIWGYLPAEKVFGAELYHVDVVSMEKPTENIVECFIRCRGLLSGQMLETMVNKLSGDQTTQNIYYFYHQFYETLEGLPSSLSVPQSTTGLSPEAPPKP